jgi:hypothetical protein
MIDMDTASDSNLSVTTQPTCTTWLTSSIVILIRPWVGRIREFPAIAFRLGDQYG